MLISAILIASLGLTLFFTFLIFSKKQRVFADTTLIVWLLLIAFHLIAYYFEVNQLNYYDVLAEFSGAFVFLHGPLILLYITAIYEQRSFSKLQLLHFAPMFLNMIIIPTLVNYDNYSIDMALAIFKIASCFVYPIVILQFLSRYKEEMKVVFSEIESKQMNWLKIIVVGFLLINVVSAICLTLQEMRLVYIGIDGELFTVLFLSFYVFTFGYYGLRQTDVFLNDIPIFKETEYRIEVKQSSIKSDEKYLRTGLDTKASISKYKELQNFIVEHKPYLDPEITLFKLAEQFKMPSNQLSQVINQNANKSFFEFINTFRVYEVIKQIEQEKHKELTLLSIAFSAGFNSKSSFNRVFKKNMKCTPSEYIKQYKSGKNEVATYMTPL